MEAGTRPYLLRALSWRSACVRARRRRTQGARPPAALASVQPGTTLACHGAASLGVACAVASNAEKAKKEGPSCVPPSFASREPTEARDLEPNPPSLFSPKPPQGSPLLPSLGLVAFRAPPSRYQHPGSAATAERGGGCETLYSSVIFVARAAWHPWLVAAAAAAVRVLCFALFTRLKASCSQRSGLLARGPNFLPRRYPHLPGRSWDIASP